MVGKPFPSGHPLADRRAAYAETMAHLGDIPVAIEVLAGALALAPNWAAGWFRLGEFLEMVGAKVEAADAWRKAQAADPSDPFGAGLKLDLMRDVPVSESIPAALVDKLDYRGPALLLSALQADGFTHATQALDLGCGTGLMGEELRPFCDWLGGIDISQGMLDEAAGKGIYDNLTKHDLGALAPSATSYDLIVAADVFIYLGALEQIIGWIAGALAPKGRLAFTIERGTAPFELRESRRFAHSPAYVTEVLDAAGFHAIRLQDCVLRQDRGVDIAALCVVASRGKVAPSTDRRNLSLDHA